MENDLKGREVKLLDLRVVSGGVEFKVHVQARARRNEVVGLWAQTLKIRVTAPPVGGAANQACRELLANWLKVPKESLEIVRGQHARTKTVRVYGLLPEKVALFLKEKLTTREN